MDDLLLNVEKGIYNLEGVCIFRCTWFRVNDLIQKRLQKQAQTPVIFVESSISS